MLCALRQQLDGRASEPMKRCDQYLCGPVIATSLGRRPPSLVNADSIGTELGVRMLGTRTELYHLRLDRVTDTQNDDTHCRARQW